MTGLMWGVRRLCENEHHGADVLKAYPCFRRGKEGMEPSGVEVSRLLMR